MRRQNSSSTKSTSSSAGLPARASRKAGGGRGSATLAEGSRSGSSKSRRCGGHAGSSGRTSQRSCPRTGGKTLVPSSGKWGSSGTGTRGKFWTRETSASPRAGGGCFLVGYLGDWRRAAAVFSDLESVHGNLEAGRDVAPEGGGAGAEGPGTTPTRAFALKGNAINRRLGVASQGIAVREELMYCVTKATATR